MSKIAYLWPNKLHERNRARYQRIISISSDHKIYLIMRGSQPVNQEILDSALSVYMSPSIKSSNYIDQLVYYIYAAAIVSYLSIFCSLNAVHTFPGPSTHLGAVFKFVLNLNWVLDILDDPGAELEALEENRMGLKKAVYKLHVYLSKSDLKYADVIIVIGWSKTEGMGELVNDKYNIPKDRILPVPNGVDLADTKPPDTTNYSESGKFTIFYVGSIKRIRGIEVLVESFAEFQKEISVARLQILGPARTKEDYQELLERIKQLGIEDKVLFTGKRVDHDIVLQKMSQSDICVLPLSEKVDNYKYTLPIKLFEYLAMSKPVVATDLEGISRVITSYENGILVEPGNVEEMFEALLELYENKELRTQCRNNARPSIQKYNWDNVNQRISDAYTELEQKDP